MEDIDGDIHYRTLGVAPSASAADIKKVSYCQKDLHFMAGTIGSVIIYLRMMNEMVLRMKGGFSQEFDTDEYIQKKTRLL